MTMASKERTGNDMPALPIYSDVERVALRNYTGAIFYQLNLLGILMIIFFKDAETVSSRS